MSDLEKLKYALEGKTILAIEPGNAAESICRFKLSNGKTWRLFATDLGFWIEETEGVNGFNCLNDMIKECFHYLYMNRKIVDSEDIKIEVKDDSIDLICLFDKKIFSIFKSKISENEMKILNHSEGCKILQKSVACGDMWKCEFTEWNDACPKELQGLI